MSRNGSHVNLTLTTKRIIAYILYLFNYHVQFYSHTPVEPIQLSRGIHSNDVHVLVKFICPISFQSRVVFVLYILAKWDDGSHMTFS